MVGMSVGKMDGTQLEMRKLAWKKKTHRFKSD